MVVSSLISIICTLVYVPTLTDFPSVFTRLMPALVKLIDFVSADKSLSNSKELSAPVPPSNATVEPALESNDLFIIN